MKLSSFGILTFIFLLTIGLSSCGSKKGDQANGDEFKQAEESLKDEIEDVVYNIPSPSEIPYMLQATGAEFNQNLLSDRKKADQYLSRNDKAALNLGVYAADIGYLVSYDKTQDAINYMNAAKKLADNLGILGSFDADLLKRFEANVAKKDSLANMVNKAIHETEKYLKNDNRNKPAALMLTGSFVEGLYISTGLIKTYPKNLLKEDDRNLILTPIIRVVLQQKESVNELLKMLSAVDQSEPVGGLVADLTSLQSSYKALNIEEQIKNNRADLLLSDKNLTEITSIVEKIRKSIVE
ncbi:MAG: hypothetical protein JSS93_14360 [Bacteroidetes bacterium]|nr:hypothetical protein [Bacteroidota bacterium]MBS1559192.1 hypothetical protein [Bacteroidota bacterium]